MKNNFLKKLFTKKEIEEEPASDTTEVEAEVEEELDNDNLRCDACKLGIQSQQKSVKKQGKRYHVKPCWRNLQKIAKQQAFG